MKNYILKIKSIGKATRDVPRIVIEKPGVFDFVPGQETEISINKKDWLKEKRPFTFTNLPTDDFLEFNIKTYREHKGVTNELLHLKQNDELLLHGVIGTINYKGKGIFIASGAGVTPFISILRNLKAKNEISNNILIFANKTIADIILEKEFQELLGDAYINILSEDQIEGYHHGRITEEFLKTTISNFS